MARERTDSDDPKPRSEDEVSRYARRSAHLPHLGDDASRRSLRSLRNIAAPGR